MVPLPFVSLTLLTCSLLGLFYHSVHVIMLVNSHRGLLSIANETAEVFVLPLRFSRVSIASVIFTVFLSCWSYVSELFMVCQVSVVCRLHICLKPHVLSHLLLCSCRAPLTATSICMTRPTVYWTFIMLAFFFRYSGSAGKDIIWHTFITIVWRFPTKCNVL